MLSVEQADAIILSSVRDYGEEEVPFMSARGRVLREALRADRDQPPFNRVSMDGIAVRFADFKAGCRRFRVVATIAAGEELTIQLPENHCFEIMTGAALPETADTVIPYEHLNISDGWATLVKEPERVGQNIHARGSDARAGAVLAEAGRVLGTAELSAAASVGQTSLKVAKLPRTVVFSTGNELVDAGDTPLPYQIRRSNVYAVQAALQLWGIVADTMHLSDEPAAIRSGLEQALANYDLVIMSGGISAGKFDFIPEALEAAGVHLHFRKVKQRPGKPFCFGTFGVNGVVFALPGNPVSTFMCTHRYILPWLQASMGIQAPRGYAVLDRPLRFEPDLQWFVQVKLHMSPDGRLLATPVEHHGSGDYASLLQADAFLEFPADQNQFSPGTTYPCWKFK